MPVNIVIPSNTESFNRKNFINDFEMNLLDPIDALNKHAYIEVLNVMYPKTINNINDDECFFSLTYNFEDLSDQNPSYLCVKYLTDYAKYVYNGVNNKFMFETGIINIANGVYTLEDLLKVMNNRLEEYGVKLREAVGGKINIIWNSFFQIWIKQKQSKYFYFNYEGKFDNGFLAVDKKKVVKFTDNLSFDGVNVNLFHPYNYKNTLPFPKASKYDDGFFSTVKMKLHFSDSLKYILGFELNDITFTSHIKYENKSFEENIFSITGDYLPDIQNGLSNMYIYCDQLESMIVGNSNSELLCIVPLEKNQGDGEIVSYQPPSSKKRFKKNHIDKLHITLKNSKGHIIPFDFGKLNIEGLIHYV